ncbi:MAG: hypothetical protein CL568_09570 [Alphaproteobacteria bacterium]|nr:hypothetical protein [Alphaproteobacteria bacterium]PPR13952.1 MAG: 2-haloacrylate reductase [Alphaproteobacteria bacterium MarineAlpha12_Bin1]|tara:strand:+ start:10911 stop:11891 length:981 start_codon:yes stop_codon:yes gene_type:complete
MRAILCKEWGNPDSLILGESDSPEPGAGEVKIRVRAAGVNYADLVLIRGQYQEKPDFPFSPGLEGAGEVLEIGEEVTNLSVGQRVMAVTSKGAFAEEAIVPSNGIFSIPDGMDYFDAAVFPVAYGTSHLALKERGNLKPGETLLVLGAAGGVGLTAIECGKAIGAKVIAAASSDEKLNLTKSYGADHTINYLTEDLRSVVREVTDGKGVDMVYDPVGGEFSLKAMRSLAQQGRYLVIGFAAGDIPSFPANYLLIKNISVIGIYWGWYRTNQTEIFRKSFSELSKWYSEGLVSPHVSQKFSLSEAPEALSVLETRKAMGRLVIDIDG